MGIWDRLGTVIKSYLNDEDEKIFGASDRKGEASYYARHDPDLHAAYEELDEFLAGKDSAERPTERSSAKPAGKPAEKPKEKPIPEQVRNDFAELGLAPGASAEECKEAYKKLLKIHHPDRHAVNSNQLNQATEMTARFNAAYKRLVQWFKE